MKWHQAHTTWFFETFVLRPFLPGYEAFNEDYRWLFNSYYNSLGEEIPAKQLRASFSRPLLNDVIAFRAHVDDAMEQLFTRHMSDEARRRTVLGLNHEQQHQELMLTDIKHAFFSNPLRPAYDAAPLSGDSGFRAPDLMWHHFDEGTTEIGHCPDSADSLDFCFDNETPRHKVHLHRFQFASRAVTCRECLEFMSDGGYARPELWLSDGWESARRLRWQAPLYWERGARDGAGWRVLKAAMRERGRVTYAPCDVSPSALDVACTSIESLLPGVELQPVVSNYVTDPPQLTRCEGNTLALYIGSSIGNFSPGVARTILRNLRSQLLAGDSLLLGTDMVKDEEPLLAAYDDRGGVTAEFNLNILRRVNRELRADFNLSGFRHRVRWNRPDSRIEMHLESVHEQHVRIPGADLSVHFAKGETIHTENSYKFTRPALAALLEDAGFTLEQTWADPLKWYALTLAGVR